MFLRNILYLILFSSVALNAQTLQKPVYCYQDLSSSYYKKQKDSIIKFFPCPKLYEQKTTQKKYQEFWDERIEMIKSRIEHNQYVHAGDIQNYLDSILLTVYIKNKNLITDKPLLFVDRASSINAYSCGLNLVFLDMGLICYAKTREELAFALCHELSHNILKHADESMKENSLWLTSKEYESSLEQIRKEKFEKLTKLINIHKTFVFSSLKHSRYSESDADSLAVVLLKNSKIPFDANFLKRLDSTDIFYRNSLKNNLSTYFNAYDITINISLTQQRTKGLSTRKYNFKDTTNIEDSLKTHPDCIVRYMKTLPFATPNTTYSPIPDYIEEESNKILLWNLYDDKHLTSCLYRIFLEKDKGNKDPWYDFMIYNVFYGLNYSCKALNRFNAIGVLSKEYISSTYYDLQNLLEQMPEEEIGEICNKLSNAGFWGKLRPEETDLKHLMANMIDPDLKPKEKSLIAQAYKDKYPSSLYGEFADHFIIKLK